jgi:LysR family transcriptional activator of nhaA
MEWLNYHHLLYFWTVVREGGIVPAAKSLRLAHPTVSAQIKQLEASLDEQLFDRSGRRLVLTEVGQLVYRYADEIFTVGRELMDALRQRPTGRPIRLAVGVTDVMPKLVVRQLLQPALALEETVRLVVEEDRHERLLAELALHSLDVVLADAPVPPASPVRAFNHLLGECGISLCAAPALAARLREGFPGSLDGAPFLLPMTGASLRRCLDQWLDSLEVRPDVVAELEDSALLKVFGGDGVGVFAVPDIIEEVVTRQHGVEVLGRTTEVMERFYAISVERRLKHPAVVAISDSARQVIFGRAVG